MDYQNYMVIDFTMAAAVGAPTAADEAFFHWVWQPDERSDKFWAAWLEQHPHKREEVEEARWLILNIREFFQTRGSAENPSALY